MMSNFYSIKHDFKILIRHTKQQLNDDSLSDDLKGLQIITAVATANSLYEKYLKHILKDKSDLFINTYPDSKRLLLLQYRNGKKLEHMSYLDISNFVDNIDNETYIEEHFIQHYKDLGKIDDVKELLTIHTSMEVINKILRKSKIGLSFNNLVNQLHLDYKSIRTSVIHGDYRNLKTLYFIWRQKILPFLYRVYLIVNIINLTTNSNYHSSQTRRFPDKISRPSRRQSGNTVQNFGGSFQ